MKKFQFRLQSVLKVRSIETDQQAKKLALAQLEVARAKNEYLALEKSFSEEMARIQVEAGHGGFYGSHALLSIDYRTRLKREMQSVRRRLKELEAKADIERQKLMECEKKRRTLEKFREKEKEAYEEEAKRYEAKQADDNASMRFDFQSPFDRG